MKKIISYGELSNMSEIWDSQSKLCILSLFLIDAVNILNTKDVWTSYSLHYVPISINTGLKGEQIKYLTCKKSNNRTKS